MKKKFLIVSVNNYFQKLKKNKKFKFYFINNRKKLTLKNLNRIKPNFIFIPHWHWKIKESIILKFNCIGFHCAPLPYGRGGSPIQNLIIRGYKKTEICAFQMNKDFDAGDVYLRTSLSLSGSGSEIFKNLYDNIVEMIIKLINKLPKPQKQVGKVVFFKRRTPAESEINFNQNLDKIHDFIRMLDVDFKNFPKAFYRVGNYKLILFDSKINRNNIVGRFSLSRKK